MTYVPGRPHSTRSRSASRRVLALAVGALSSALVLTACGGPSHGTHQGEDLQVVASIYPLTYVAQRVGGDHVTVSTLTAPGVDPHDLELSPQDVLEVRKAGLVIYSSGFQPAVDDAVGSQGQGHSFDVTPSARLEAHGVEEHAEDGDTDDEHAHDHDGTDPHFWLDPQRYAEVATALGEELARIDPEHAATYRSHAKQLVTDLTALDDDYHQGLAHCAQQDVVTTHPAFGYLTKRYGLRQVAISGIGPETELSLTRLAEVTELVRRLGIRAIYAEVLSGPVLARTIASETGATVLVLDPLEGQSNPDLDYLAVMRANLATLRQGQECS